MSIISRFTEVMTANINSYLDQIENPSKMAEQTLNRLEKDMVQVKGETANVMAQEMAAKRHVDAVEKEILSLTDLAKQAVSQGNEDDARVFIEKRTELLHERERLCTNYELAKGNSIKIHQMHNKLEADIRDLRGRTAMIQGTAAMAKAQDHINKVTSNGLVSTRSLDSFNRWEEKAQSALDKAEALTELQNEVNYAADPIAALKIKYKYSTEDIERQIEAIRNEINKDSVHSKAGEGDE